MNVQAAFKTLLVVLAIGAASVWSDWKQAYGGSAAEQAARETARCIEEGKGAAYRAHPLMMGRDLDATHKEIEARCRQQTLANVPAATAAPAGPTYATDAQPQKAKPSQAHQAAAAAPATVAAPPITTRRDKCLERIEEARKRSPGGLNPEWEQDQRNRCEAQ